MICNTFKNLANNTWNKISESRQANFQLKEETITDLNLLELKLRHPHQVITKEFSKPIEGKNGADWEWWFSINGNQWIGFRIQAKILINDTNEFEHLHYQKRGVYQCDKLISNALNTPFPKVPLYCLYIQTDDTSLLNQWNCYSFPVTKKLLGCSLLSAFEVKKLRGTRSKHLTDVENLMKPWHCLVCCSGYGQSDSITNMDEYVKNNFELDAGLIKGLDFEIPDSFIIKEPPSYVISIIEQNQFSYENYTLDEKVIRPPDADLDGVLIYRFKE